MGLGPRAQLMHNTAFGQHGTNSASVSVKRGRLDRCRSLARRPLYHPVSDHAHTARQHLGSYRDVLIIQAASSADLRAAATIRAASFYHYPTERSEFAIRSHRRMMVRQECEDLELKLAGICPGWRGCKVTCLLAVIADPFAGSDDRTTGLVQHGGIAEGATAHYDPLCRLPPLAPDGCPKLVVGTLDINRGTKLPSEELIGRWPAVGGRQRRTYLSNVCVAVDARRQGVAAKMIAEAKRLAAAQGVQHMYVHARLRNHSAQRLYSSTCGFTVEQRETEAVARGLGRPPRVLLHCDLGP